MDFLHAIDYTIDTSKEELNMHITNTTRQEIADKLVQGYNKGFAHDANGQVVIWELTIRLER